MGMDRRSRDHKSKKRGGGDGRQERGGNAPVYFFSRPVVVGKKVQEGECFFFFPLPTCVCRALGAAALAKKRGGGAQKTRQVLNLPG